MITRKVAAGIPLISFGLFFHFFPEFFKQQKKGETPKSLRELTSREK